MSDMQDDPDLLAAEYVLGTLDDATAADLRQRARDDPVLRAAISAWEKRLAPLASLASPVIPPTSLWQQIAASAAIDVATESSGPLARAWRSLMLWRCATGVAFAGAAALAALLWLPAPPARPVAALVPQGSAAAAYIAEQQADGTLRIVALQPVTVAQGKDLELWALPAGTSRPIPLGLVPTAVHGVAPKPPAANGTQLMISLEPRGGSPTGLPTGPVLFAGTLRSD